MLSTCLQIFEDKFDNDLKNVVSAFKAARYFLPWKVDELRPTIADIDLLNMFLFIDAKMLTDLKKELAEYIAAAEGVVKSIDLFTWWQENERNNNLMAWVKAFKLVALVQPSSAAAERVFSLLKLSFSPQQCSAMEDYIQTSIMLQYNS